MTRKTRLELDNNLKNEMCQLIVAGMPRLRACSKLSVSMRTYRRWYENAKEAAEKEDYENIFFEFIEALDAAESAFIASAIDDIKYAGKKDWRAAAWLLERTFPSEFSKEVGKAASEPVIVATTNEAIQITPEAAQKVIDDDKARRSRRARTKHFGAN